MVRRENTNGGAKNEYNYRTTIKDGEIKGRTQEKNWVVVWRGDQEDQ